MADWTRLTQRLAASGDGRVELSFTEIERTIGAPLPGSSKYPAFWSNSSSYARAWKRAGYIATRRGVATGHMAFVRVSPNATVGTPLPADVARSTTDITRAPTERAAVVLVGCVKRKATNPTKAQELYQSQLFARRRTYALAAGVPWFILSAEHGLVAPATVIAPYDVYLADQSDDYRRAWGEWVAARLEREVGSLLDLTIEVHAGAAYVDAIHQPLTRRGARLFHPVAGLRRGEQLAWYDAHRGTGTRTDGSVEAPDVGPTSTPAPQTASDQKAIIDALLDYAAVNAPDQPGTSSFTPHPEANALVMQDPFAFLLAVIFDQGIPAERAWRAPYELRQRLGHLDPQRMATEPGETAIAVAMPPVLHRYREKMPGWLTQAAKLVVADYHGDAGRIWRDEPTARELQARLRRFPGIGQKKAAMAVELLERDLGVPVRELDGSDVAYDVHVRRVFLRTGLAEYDDLDHMVDVARRANPDRPGAIDAPAWLIGRQWCHAGYPDCGACALSTVCPKDLARANRVRGA
jgi:uncharacterized HhH-GPD family protein